jgi:hypothetical protein
MADNVRISQQSQALTVRGPGAGGHGRQGAVQTTPTQPMANDEFQRAVAKLNRTLDAGTELRTNVPRGFYLNIRV